MKIVGAGFGRTGTSSLKAALEILGFGPCYHMTEVFAHPEHAPLWEAAGRGEAVNWDGLLGDYEAAVDWPACTFYRELMEEYPEAKVLLSVRDPEKWYESTRNTIYELSQAADRSPISRFVYGAMTFVIFGGFMRGGMIEEIIWRGTFDGRFEDKPYAMEVFERHNEEVKRRVPPERLLIYEVKEGWGPLCEFLGVEIPDEPFPHLNDTADMRRVVWILRAISFVVPAVSALLLAWGLRRLLSRRDH